MPTPGIDSPFTVWDIANMERNVSDGVVFTVHYTVTHFEEGEQVGAYGSLGLEAPDPSSMIPYANLEKSTVVEWVKGALGADKVAEVEAALSQQAQEKLHPTKTSGVPWS